MDINTALGVVVDKDGWARYTAVLAGKLDLKDKTTHVVTGVKNADGTCTISESGTVQPGELGYYGEPIAYNETTCQEVIESGELTPTSVQQLKAAQTTEASSTPSSDTGTAALETTETPAAAAAASTRTTKAYTGSRWIDPLNIVITALTIDLSWTHTSSSVRSAAYTIKPYEFRYDGWSNSGTPHPPFTFKPGSVNVTAAERFTNTDFEQLLLTIAALFGGPGAAAAVLAACGFSVAPAVFRHNESITGLASGGYLWSYTDRKSGGCSGLVHHGNYNGFGTW